ncbi:hypothetical protein F4819DRAFT_469111 [Hypoxylon fuscum]|nr:hypothetical protein F4819DRAFT_469111 [Hypoxylon fuscum]
MSGNPPPAPDPQASLDEIRQKFLTAFGPEVAAEGRDVGVLVDMALNWSKQHLKARSRNLTSHVYWDPSVGYTDDGTFRAERIREARANQAIHLPRLQDDLFWVVSSNIDRDDASFRDSQARTTAFFESVYRMSVEEAITLGMSTSHFAESTLKRQRM